MRRALTVALAALMVVLAGGPLGAQTAVAQSQSVTSWVTVGTTTPATGCIVDTAVEVRSGGAPVAGADVVVNLSIDDGSSTVISSDRTVTDDAGISGLVFDTSGAWDGAKTWLEVIVNGSYLGGQTVWIDDASSCSGASTVLELSGDVASVADSVVTDTEVDVADDSGAVLIPNVSAYHQDRPLSCEFAALSIATGALGNWVSEYSFDNVVGWSANPHWGYRGDIYGSWGNTTDYGVYAEALAAALPTFGFQGTVFYGQGSTAQLTDSLDAGMPTLVWLGMWGDTAITETTADGTSYQVMSGMHVMTAYGYDDGGLYLSDPGSGKLRYYDWGTFRWMWDVMDGMALAVSW